MFSPSLMKTPQATLGGMDAMENRVRRLEAMMQTMASANKPATIPVPAPEAFKTYLGPQTPPPKLTPIGNPERSRCEAFEPMIQDYATQHGVDPDLVIAVVRQESAFNPNAVSRCGAQGLMQLMPATAKSLGVTNAFDPAQNLDGGIRHLAGLLSQYHGNIPLALAAYNAGGGAVARHNGIPPYKETQQYVRKILAAYLQTKNTPTISSPLAEVIPEQ